MSHISLITRPGLSVGDARRLVTQWWQDAEMQLCECEVEGRERRFEAGYVAALGRVLSLLKDVHDE